MEQSKLRFILDSAIKEFEAAPLASIGAICATISTILTIIIVLHNLSSDRPKGENNNQYNLATNFSPYSDVVSFALFIFIIPPISFGFALIASHLIRADVSSAVIGLILLYTLCSTFLSLASGTILSDWLIHRELSLEYLEKLFNEHNEYSIEKQHDAERPNYESLIVPIRFLSIVINFLVLLSFWLFISDANGLQAASPEDEKVSTISTWVLYVLSGISFPIFLVWNCTVFLIPIESKAKYLILAKNLKNV